MLDLVNGFLPPPVKSRLKSLLHIPDMELALQRLARIGFRPAATIDVGANVGAWSQMCRRVFPDTRILAVEPQDPLQAALRETARKLGNVTIAQTLLGARAAAAVPFYVYEFSGMSSVLRDAEAPVVGTTSVDMVTLDELVAKTQFPPAQLMKLDVQGYELEVLRGGARTLAAVEVVLTEVSLLPLYEGAPILHEVVAFMADAGFRVYDFCSERRRPLDDALFQTDLLFVRSSSPMAGAKPWR
jgi:FkbM family methyltransferase